MKQPISAYKHKSVKPPSINLNQSKMNDSLLIHSKLPFSAADRDSLIQQLSTQKKSITMAVRKMASQIQNDA